MDSSGHLPRGPAPRWARTYAAGAIAHRPDGSASRPTYAWPSPSGRARPHMTVDRRGAGRVEWSKVPLRSPFGGTDIGEVACRTPCMWCLPARSYRRSTLQHGKKTTLNAGHHMPHAFPRFLRRRVVGVLHARPPGADGTAKRLQLVQCLAWKTEADNTQACSAQTSTSAPGKNRTAANFLQRERGARGRSQPLEHTPARERPYPTPRAPP